MTNYLDEKVEMLFQAGWLVEDPKVRRRNHYSARLTKNDVSFLFGAFDDFGDHDTIRAYAAYRVSVLLRVYDALLEQNAKYTAHFREDLINALDGLVRIAQVARSERKKLFENAGNVDDTFSSYLRQTQNDLADLKEGAYIDEYTLRPALRLAALLKLVGEQVGDLDENLAELHSVTISRDGAFDRNDPIGYVLCKLKNIVDEGIPGYSNPRKHAMILLNKMSKNGLPAKYFYRGMT